MKLFSFNEGSILNNSVVRWANCVFLILILGCGMSNASILSIPHWVCILISVAVPIMSTFATGKVLCSTEFYEWDYTERKKKHRFTLTYSLVCVLISSLLSFSIAIAFFSLSSIPFSASIALIFLIPVLFFAFNLCNIVSLYYPLFEDDLATAYKIQKKPSNWQEDGREIKEEDEIDEIIHRDFGI